MGFRVGFGVRVGVHLREDDGDEAAQKAGGGGAQRARHAEGAKEAAHRLVRVSVRVTVRVRVSASPRSST